MRQIEIAIPSRGSVSGLWLAPPDAWAALVLAHGAGAGMAHKGMNAVAEGLAVRGVATLRFNFPYMEAGGKRVDPPAVAQAAVRAAVEEGRRLAPALPFFAGGRSFGGRMTSQAEAAEPLPGARGLVFFAFPLHPAGKPGVERAAHLNEIAIPMLFLAGDRDALAEPQLLAQTASALGSRALLHSEAHADHAFHVPARSGRTDAEVMASLLDVAAGWMRDRA